MPLQFQVEIESNENTKGGPIKRHLVVEDKDVDGRGFDHPTRKVFDPNSKIPNDSPFAHSPRLDNFLLS